MDDTNSVVDENNTYTIDNLKNDFYTKEPIKKINKNKIDVNLFQLNLNAFQSTSEKNSIWNLFQHVQDNISESIESSKSNAQVLTREILIKKLDKLLCAFRSWFQNYLGKKMSLYDIAEKLEKLSLKPEIYECRLQCIQKYKSLQDKMLINKSNTLNHENNENNENLINTDEYERIKKRRRELLQRQKSNSSQNGIKKNIFK